MGALKKFHRTLGRAFGDAPSPTVWVGDLGRLGSDYDFFFVWVYDTSFPMKGWTPKGWQLAKAGVCQSAMQEERASELAATAGGSAPYQRYVFIHDRDMQVLYLGDLGYLHGQVCGGLPYQVQVFHGLHGLGEQALPAQTLPPPPPMPPPPLPGPPPTPAPPRPTPSPLPKISAGLSALLVAGAAALTLFILYKSEVLS